MPGEPYLDFPKYEIQKFFGKKPLTVLFIPYATVTLSYDTYTEKVKPRFAEIGYKIVGIHTLKNPLKAIEEAEAIVVGGGNTWKLVRMLHDLGQMPAIRERVISGVPYAGWSAGANIACPSLRTTNDMPIIDPKGFDCMDLVPFQINPHYLDTNPKGHSGETREQRILEFLEINPGVHVVGLREGTMLKLEGQTLTLAGNKTARIFLKGEKAKELSPENDFSFLLNPC
ncbi:Alpha-aspartyl dipeptidase Peptidase E [hydrothermal vent metagenome]|uniref:Alpha-aspartyl dipeptidase Peptidase E n=1 Tax=hydrothermal vent metagenome TaxID=652676 RepID=A0A3B0U7R1_9ZZZZ